MCALRQLPAGTITLLFTDIEGSTQVLHELGDSYGEVLAEHRRLLREAFSRHGGVEVDTQGDALFVAFTRASDAANAALDGQRALAGGPVRVRMGAHTGEPVVTAEGYVGMDVHRGARVMSAGHGGQILLSQTTRDLLEGAFPLLDLGEHRLKDLTAPQRLYQLGGGDFPPPRTLSRTNLPIQPTPLVGRERDLEEAGALLRTHRLLTLTGPGGSGKTRLALQLAAEAAERFPDGVFWVPLQALRDPALVDRAIAASVGAADDLVAYVGSKRLLVLLDNFEQVIEAAPSITSLLAGTQGASVLVPAASRCSSKASSATRSTPCRSTTQSSSSRSVRSWSRPASSRRRRSWRSADGWTAFRSPSSSQPHESRCSTRTSCWLGWSSDSPC
jgi:class 3 adenylate cyclase